MRRRVAALVLLLCCVLCAFSARASKFGYPVDIETMKELEELDEFDVRVTEKKVILERYDRDTVSTEGADMLLVTVKNFSDTAVTGVRVGFIAVDENGLTADISGKGVRLSSIGGKSMPEMEYLTKSGIALEPWEELTLALRVDYSKFKGIRAMVESYETAEGTVTNPGFEMWQTYAFGLNAGSSTELD